MLVTRTAVPSHALLLAPMHSANHNYYGYQMVRIHEMNEMRNCRTKYTKILNIILEKKSLIIGNKLINPGELLIYV